ncbi:hypothetical protein GH714_030683 [Hevea brasiliensis]|uniref:Dual specificity protein phosphatase DSP8 n=1 Tax=Hevea brasiliensis TaxID=3981 RepID=A0A6A6LCH4_HEVBR|nr:hypothetical protein GH714_030683 [Hevea brasiliensis]
MGCCTIEQRVDSISYAVAPGFASCCLDLILLRLKFDGVDCWIGFILLGAVPFPTDVPCLKELGVHGVITLNEPYETLVPTSIYHLQHKQMTPEAAYDHVKSIRPRVLLAPAQWQAVLEYYNLKLRRSAHINTTDLILKTPRPARSQDIVAFDDGSVVIVTEADLDGYDPAHDSDTVRREILADLSVVYRVRVAGQAALARISCSCLWFRCHTHQKILGEQLSTKNSCSIQANHLGGISVDIHVY